MAKFRRGQASVLDKPRAAKPKTGHSRLNIRKVEDEVAIDWRITVRELSLRTRIPYTTVQQILKHDLKLKKKCATFVPHDLTQRQMERRVAICHFWNRLFNHTPHLLHRVVTSDESWVYVYDPCSKEKSKEWLRAGKPRPQKPRREMATAKVMIITFFDSKGLI